MNPLLWLRSKVTHSVISAGELFFPPACAICEGMVDEFADPSPLFCLRCRDELWPATGSFCPTCALPTPQLPNPEGDCASCRLAKFAFDAARTLGPYELSRRQAVLRIKHAAFEPLAMQLGKLLGERIQKELFDPPPNVVAPVPMHWLKRLWRGTSAAETVAHALARTMQLQCVDDLIRCRKFLKKQSLLPAGQRWDNVRNAYAVGWGFDLRGARVLLVDDVLTTGSTANAIAKALKKAGAERVYVAAIARTTTPA